jgi:hypothetical protein
MLKDACTTTRNREKALADAVREVASELRLIESADFVAYIRTERFANINQLVNSSTEMFYQPGTMTFGRSADVYLNWGEAPSVVLDMEFHHQQVDVYFRLMLDAVHAGVEIDYITFEDASPDPEVNTQRLVQAIADARIGPPLPVRSSMTGPSVGIAP